MKDRLREYALIAEIVSAVAIVLSLLFVGLQIRQGTAETAANSRALEANVRESMLNADLSVLQAELPIPRIAVLNDSGTEPTNAEEISQLRTYSYMMSRTRENYWNQYSNGMLDRDTYLSYRDPYLDLLERSDFHLEVWSAGGSVLVPGFVAEINEELRKRGRISTAEQGTVVRDND